MGTRYSSRVVNFPSHDEPRKNKKWISDFAKACWDDFGSINCNSFYSGRHRYDTIKRYMEGNQDMGVYFDLLDVNSANEDKSWLRHTKSPLKIAPKYERIALSNLLKNQFDIDIRAIDPTSVEEQTEYYARNKARMIWRNAMKENGGDPNMIPKPEGDYENEEDLDLYMEYTYKHRLAVEAEQAIKLVLSNSKFSAIRESQMKQLIRTGIISYRDYFDANGEPRVEDVDARDIIVSRYKKEDGSDLLYIGEVKDYSIADLRVLDKDKELSKNQYDEAYAKAKGIVADHLTYDSVDPRDYESQRIKILQVEFKSTDTILVEKGKDKNGNETVSIKDITYRKNPKNEYEEMPLSVIYEANWIVGTDIFFGCQRSTNIKRAYNNLADVCFSRHIYTPQLVDMETESLAEAFVPLIDTIQISFMKYQDVLIRAKKSGYQIDVTALENIPLGQGGQAMTPPQVLDFFNKTGNIITRSIMEDGKVMQRLPISPVPSLFANDAAGYWEAIQEGIRMLQQISGFNDITDGSTPSERMLNGTAKLAAESTNNSIDFLRRAEKISLENLMYGVLARVQDAAENGSLEGYINAMGRNSVEFFKLSPEVSARELGLQIIDKPNEFERQDLKDAVNIAIQQGQITIADKYYIMNVENIKHAQAILSLRVKKNLEMQQKINEQNIQLNKQVQQESAMQAHQLKLEEIQAEAAAKIQVINVDKKWDYDIKKLTVDGDMINKDKEVAGRVQQNEIQARAKEYSADRQSKTQKELKEAEMEVETEES